MKLTGKIENTPLLEVLEVIAYSGQSGVLSVNGPSAEGTVLFDRGNIICAHTASTQSLLSKVATEEDPRSRIGLRRVHALASLAELFDLKEGLFHFTKKSAPATELAGVSLGPFYAAGGMDTGDLLLLLAKVMDPGRQRDASVSTETEVHTNKRRYPRFGPMMIPAELLEGGFALKGYLTNLSLGGSFFHAEDLPEVDRVYELHFALPRGLGRCQATAKVVWVRAHVVDAGRGVGLLFEWMPTDSKMRLTGYLNQFQKLVTDMDLNA
jgi:hypothetical protein